MKKIFGHRDGVWAQTCFALCATVFLCASGSPFAFADSTTPHSQDFNGVGALGIGLSVAHQEVGSNENDQNPGSVTARYWFNDKWGFDGGVGMGFPAISHNSSFLTNFSLEPLYAIKRSGRSVFYADFLAMPGIESVSGNQSGQAFILSLSGGLGFETALADFPQIRWFAQLNPLSYEHNVPTSSSGNKITSSFDFLGSNMVWVMGFHYYL